MPDAFSIELSEGIAEDVALLEASAAVCNPHALQAAIDAAKAHGSHVVCIVARGGSGGIAGYWPFSICRTPPGVRVLKAPIIPLYDLSGSPLVGASHAGEVIGAMLQQLKDGRSPSRVLVLRNLHADGPIWDALQAANRNGLVSLDPIDLWERALFDRSAAPSAESYLHLAISSGSRKRIRAKRNALEEGGKLSFLIHSISGTISEAFERFMVLEASGWKGESGTALRQKPSDAAYVLSVMTGLAPTGRAFVAEMTLGDRAIASGLFLRYGAEVFFWKTAYDDSLAKQSPGVLFDMELTEWLYAQDWFERLDTGSDNSVDPSTLIWKQRRPMANVVVSLDPGSLQGRAVVAGLKARNALKRLKSRF